MAIAEMRKLLAVPDYPTAAPSESDWAQAESKLGTQLPQDYKDFITEYGEGSFYGFLGILSPFSKTTSLFDRMALMCELSHYIEVPIFPASHGLLVFASDENGNQLYWRTDGDPLTWPIVYASADWIDVEEFHMSMTEFLVGWISGIVRPRLIEEVMTKLHIRERPGPIFRPGE